MTQQNPAARTRRPWISAPRCLLAFLAVYLLAVWTPFGQRAENALFGGEGAGPAWIYGWSGAAYGSSAMPPLEHTALPTLAVGTALVAAVALVRRRWWQGCAALGVIVATVGGKEIARALLPRPDLVGARESLLETSFPSGHVAVPAALALAAVLVASPRVRPYVTAAGMLWLTVTAAAVLATYHHRPSDVLGTTLLACACHRLATRLLPPADTPAPIRLPRGLPTIALTLSAAGALVAGARADSLTESLVFATAAFLCAALFWSTTTRPLPRRAPGPDHTSPAPEQPHDSPGADRLTPPVAPARTPAP
ncbi:phosphatase PAP2 family protein [Streptomyces sp. PGLac3x]